MLIGPLGQHHRPASRRSLLRSTGLRSPAFAMLSAVLVALTPPARGAEVQVRSTFVPKPFADQTRFLISGRLGPSWFGSLELAYSHGDWRWDRPAYIQPQLGAETRLSEALTASGGLFWLATPRGDAARPFAALSYAGIRNMRLAARYRHERELYRSRTRGRADDHRVVHRLDLFVWYAPAPNVTLGYEGVALLMDGDFRFANGRSLLLEHGVSSRLHLFRDSYVIAEAAHAGTYVSDGDRRHLWRLRVGVGRIF